MVHDQFYEQLLSSKETVDHAKKMGAEEVISAVDWPDVSNTIVLYCEISDEMRLISSIIAAAIHQNRITRTIISKIKQNEQTSSKTGL